MCWKCDYIYAKSELAYEYEGHKKRVHLAKTLFCDDSSYSTATLSDARTVLERIGWFAAATGMELNLLKTFYIAMYLSSNERSELDVSPLSLHPEPGD